MTALNVWIVNPFDAIPGESMRQGRYIYLANMLANKGHNVTWWSSNFCHATKSFRSEGQSAFDVRHNLRMILLKTPAYHKNISVRRVWNHYVYAKELKAESKKCGVVPNVIIASCPPLLAAYEATIFAKNQGAKVVIDVQDLWPEAFELIFPRRTKWLAKLLLLPLRLLADRVYSGADSITAVTGSMLRRAELGSGVVGKRGMLLPLGVGNHICSRN